MPNGIIDLRKSASGQRKQPSGAHFQSSGKVSDNGIGGTGNELDLEWSAYEHERRIRGRYWLLYPLAIATATIVYGIVTHSYLFVIFIALSFTMLVYYAKRPVRLLSYAIEKRGIWVENKLLDFQRLKSFWIFNHPMMASELLLETAHPIHPIVYIRLENINPDEVKEVLSQYLPEKEHKDLATDQISRIIGF